MVCGIPFQEELFMSEEIFRHKNQNKESSRESSEGIE